MKEPILFVDLSYFVFYRFFALVNWYRLSIEGNGDIDIAHLHEDEVFLKKLGRICGEHMSKLQQRVGLAGKGERVFLATDCSRSTIWRHELFDGYKGARDAQASKYNREVFAYIYNIVVPELVATRGYHVLSAESVEADDIIGVMKMRLRTRYPKLPIWILTNDRDYIQLCDEYTHITNLQDKMLIPEVSAYVDLQWKILKGDSSDNIPSVFPRMQKKKLQTYIDDPALLEAALEAAPDARTRYNRNKCLIDMSMIPPHILEKMDNLWEIILASS